MVLNNIDDVFFMQKIQYQFLSSNIICISKLLLSQCSTRVSNEIGAKHPQRARLAILVVIIISISEGMMVGTVTILVRHVWGKLYSNEAEVIRYVTKMIPLLALSNFLDGFQCVLSGSHIFIKTPNRDSC